MKSLFEKLKSLFDSLKLRTAYGSAKSWICQAFSTTVAFVKKHIIPVCCCAAAFTIAIVLLIVLSGNDDSVIDVQSPSSIGNTYAISDSSPIAASTSTATPVPLPTPTPTPTSVPLLLRNGVTNDLVIRVQERLMQLNYMDNDEPTNYYGNITTDCVKLFQRRNGFDVTGELTQEGYDLLMSSSAMMYMASIGDEGEDVKDIQTRLYELEYISAVTGYFGDDTEEAVKKFQDKNGLTVDGKVGAITKEKLYSEDAIPNSLYLGSKGDDVLKYQKRLSQLGYLTTEPDGVYGSDTVTAVKRFQARNALVVDGYLGPSTKSLLMGSDAKSNKLEYTMSGSDVSNVQYRLYELNYLRASSVTGYFGGVTDAAVRLFQANNKLSFDGKVGKSTMNKLFSDTAVRSSSPVTSETPGIGEGDSGSIETFIAIAYSKLGCRYVRGGKGPNTFDCSGFVYWCLNQAGVNQSYMTSYMWRSTNRYPRISSMSNIKRGDVIVFDGHVGIALGNGQMIDASFRNGKVVVRSYNTNYWRNSFYCAYRIFGG